MTAFTPKSHLFTSYFATRFTPNTYKRPARRFCALALRFASARTAHHAYNKILSPARRAGR